MQNQVSNQLSNQLSNRDSHKFKKISLPHQTNNKFSLTKRLSRTAEAPQEYRPLWQFPRATVAEYIGIQTNYYSSILTGYKKPSPELHEILVELARNIEAEQGYGAGFVNAGEAGAVNSGNGGNGAVNAVNGAGGLE